MTPKAPEGFPTARNNYRVEGLVYASAEQVDVVGARLARRYSRPVVVECVDTGKVLYYIHPDATKTRQ